MNDSVKSRSSFFSPWQLIHGAFRANPACYSEMLASYHCNALVLKINIGKWLMLLCEQQAVGQEAGTSAERALGGDPGQLRKIIAFR